MKIVLDAMAVTSPEKSHRGLKLALTALPKLRNFTSLDHQTSAGQSTPAGRQPRAIEIVEATQVVEMTDSV